MMLHEEGRFDLRDPKRLGAVDHTQVPLRGVHQRQRLLGVSVNTLTEWLWSRCEGVLLPLSRWSKTGSPSSATANTTKSHETNYIQDFHFGPGTATVYTRVAPNTTSFRAEPCTSPPPIGARARPSAHRRWLSGLNGAPADTAPAKPFWSQKLLILARATLPTGHRQRPDPPQHVAKQPPVQMSLRQ